MAEFDPYEYIPELINDEYYIKPGTDIFILRGVPLDNTYEHTIVWENLNADRTQQRDYFLSKAKFGIPKNSYQRVDRFWLKVNVNAEYLMDCNYIMFKNTPFNMVKWYYGFITEVEYINNNTSKIRYELDVMQTWLPGQNRDYQLLPCFVERCHAMSDELYENLIPESVVNSDEYLVDDIVEFDMNEFDVVTLATEEYEGPTTIGGDDGIIVKENFKPAQGSMQFGAYGKVSVRTWHVNTTTGGDIDQLESYLNAYINAGKENCIVSMQVYPSKFRPLTGATPPPVDGEESYVRPARAYDVNLSQPKKGDKLGGKNSTFVPKNAKMYSFPFNLVRINNECGENHLYKWELFDRSRRGAFKIVGSYVWQACVVVYPKMYKHIAKNMDEAMTFTNFTVCPWASDAYRAWWAQNIVNVGATTAGGIASLIAAIVGTGVGGATANPMLVATGVGGVISAVTKITQSLHEANHQSSALHGDAKTSLVLPMIKNVKFVFTKESLRPEILRIYDDYFTRFGYAQKKVMFPNLVARERWTYVQTVGFEFNGEINDTDTKKIKSIFDNGVTFWRNPNDVGHYELDNNPLV